MRKIAYEVLSQKIKVDPQDQKYAEELLLPNGETVDGAINSIISTQIDNFVYIVSLWLVSISRQILDEEYGQNKTEGPDANW